MIRAATGGVLSALPTQLVAALRATLEEVLEADLILHVRDIAHPETEEQAADVGEILESLGVDEDVPLIEVWNKIDLLSEPLRAGLLAQDARTEGVQAVSAWTGEGVDRLLAAIEAALAEERIEEVLDLGFAEGRRRAWLHAEGVVRQELETDGGHRVTVSWTARQKARFAAL